MTVPTRVPPTPDRRASVSALLAARVPAKRPIHWRLDGDWLLLHRPVRRVIPRTQLLDLSRRNAGLDGLVKFACLPGRRVEVRAEIPLDAELDLELQINATVRGFDRANAALRRTAPKPGPAQTSQPDLEPAGPLDELAALCSGSGVAFSTRDDGALSVELPGVAGVCGHARLEQPRGAGGGFRAGLVLGECGGLGPEPMEALGVLLLSASATVRLVRAVVRPGPDGEMAGVEVEWPGSVNDRALEHALGALAAAGRFFGREVNAICDQVVARAYLDSSALGA